MKWDLKTYWKDLLGAGTDIFGQKIASDADQEKNKYNTRAFVSLAKFLGIGAAILFVISRIFK